MVDANMSPQPQAQAQPAAPAEAEQTFRVHSSYVWLSSLQGFLAFVIVFLVSSSAAIFGAIEESDPDELIGATFFAIGLVFFMVVVLGIMVAIQFASYRHLLYSVGPNEFTLYKGIFNKQRIHVPYTRVQSVDKRAQLLQRVFGVCSIYIDTAGGEANKAIIVPYVAKAQADWLISQLYARKMSALQGASGAGQPLQAQPSVIAGAPAGNPSAPLAAQPAAMTPGAVAPQAAPNGNVLDVGAEAWNQFGGVFAGQSAPIFETVRYQYGLSNKELFLAGLSNSTAFAAIVAAVICVVFQVIAFLMEAFPSEANGIADSFSQMALSATMVPILAVVTVGLIIVFVVVWLMSAVGTCLGFGGFRARRYADRIEVERGLLQHTSASVSIERIQAVVVKQTFLRRLIGYCELSLDKVDAVADDAISSDAKSLNGNGLVVHPFVKRSQVPEILAGLLPEYEDAPIDETPIARAALRRAIVRRCIWQGGGFWLAVITLVAQLVLTATFGPQLDAASGAVSAAASLLDSTSTLTGAEAADVMGMAFDYSEARFAIWATNTIACCLYAIAVVIVIVDAAGAILWARESGFAYNRRFMRITNGGLSRETRTLPRQKIQFGFTRTNPLQRMAGTATISISTAAGLGTQDSLIDVESAEASRWLDWLKPAK